MESFHATTTRPIRQPHQIANTAIEKGPSHDLGSTGSPENRSNHGTVVQTYVPSHAGTRGKRGALSELDAEVKRLREEIRFLKERDRFATPLPAQVILDNISDAFIALDLDWRIVYINPEAARINGKAAHEFIGKTHWEEWPGSVGSELERQYRLAVEQGRSVHFEHRYVAPGYDIWLEIHAYPYPSGLAIWYRDVTPRKQAEERERQLRAALKEKIDDFEALFRLMPVGVAVSEDAECRVIRVNDAMAKVIGVDPNANSSKSGPDAEQLSYRILLDGRELPADELPQQVSQREGRPCGPIELEMVHRDGESRFIYGSSVPLFDSRGAVRGSIGAYVDTTERRQAEERVRNSERIYRAVGESIPHGIWICDPDGRHVYASEAVLQLIGLTQEHCRKFGWIQAVHPEDRERVLTEWQECVRSGGKWDNEFRYLGVDGSEHPVLVRGTAVRGDTGEILCWAGMNLDVSTLKKTEAELRGKAAELERANRQLQEFVYAVAHDLREPLRTVAVFAELLLRKAPHTEAADEIGSHMLGSLRRMETLIRDLLELARALHHDAQAVPTDLNEALEEACRTCAATIRESNATVRAAALPVVLGEHDPLARVFQNLISNAIKYRKPGVEPEIEISAEEEASHCKVFVDDNGVGFEPGQAEFIFGLFKRLHGREYSGSGVGLTMCRKILERYEGSITAEARPGKGARFIVRLPLARRTEADPGAV